MVFDKIPTITAETSITIRFPDNDGKVSSDTPRFSIGYWSIRGLGAPLRMMLSAAKVDHIVLLHDIVENNENGSWNSTYFKSKKDIVENYSSFMNLPYLIDRKEKIFLCQTNAIFSYLGRELGMLGTSKAERAKCEEMLCEIYDLRNQVIKFSYESDGGDNAAGALFGSSLKHLKKFETFIMHQSDSTDKSSIHLMSDTFTAPEFHLFEMIDQLYCLSNEYKLEDPLKNFPSLRAFQTGFTNLSENSFYLKKSTLHTELPINNCMAKFASALNAKVYKRGQNAPWRNRGEIALVCSTTS